ncbi:hypothetical protein BDZ45DRAFT_458676 [Acephala macrosclerotiorum]|nr:hypothetical protein BDZ45DRAFT_458676 [Acephala macrosclerotiorum]
MVPRAIASTIPSNFSDWLHGQILPKPGTILQRGINCYNLPYRGIRFASHLLTYYTVIMLVLNRRPLLPRPGAPLPLWNSGRDTLLATLGIIGSVVIAGLNISACRFRWQFVCIGIWKLTMSFTLCSINLHQCFVIYQNSGYTFSDQLLGV